MLIICEHCHAKFNIDENKIPAGKKASFLCPKCKGKIFIDDKSMEPGIPRKSEKEQKNPLKNKKNSKQDILTIDENADYDIANRPFEYLDENAKTILICVQNDELSPIVQKSFIEMDYHIITANFVSTALIRMKYHLFNSIFLSDDFDPKNNGASILLNYIKKLNMDMRRKIFVTLLTGKYQTADSMAAFHASINLIINNKDIKNLKRIFLGSVREYEKFYSVFNESMKKIGKQ